VLHTGDIDDREALGLPQTSSTMGVLRVRQNALRESSVGMLATFGDPLGRAGSWTAGGDATFQTSRLFGNKNFLAGVWGLAMGREGLGDGERTAVGGKLDYPNDLWDVALTFRRVGDAFDPSLGFIPRPAVQALNLSMTYKPRPKGNVLGLDVRQMMNELFFTLVGDLDDRWESYRVFFAPVNWRLESGDRFEFNANPTGERLALPFEIAKGVVIPAGVAPLDALPLRSGLCPQATPERAGHLVDRGLLHGAPGRAGADRGVEAVAPVHRRAQLDAQCGALAGGQLHAGPGGGRACAVNVSSNLQLNSYLQYDNSSDSFGANTRLRWTFAPLGDLFVVYNHNLRHDIDPETGRPIDMGLVTDPTRRLDRRWGFGSNQLLVKVQYAVRY
jgi:hypothetical protein